MEKPSNNQLPGLRNADSYTPIHLEISEETYSLLEALACANSVSLCKVVESIFLEDIS